MKLINISVIFLTAALLFIPLSSYSINYNGVDIKFRGSASETYDDNITFVNDDKKNDFITNLTLGLSAKYEGKTTTLELGGGITQQIFAANHNYNNLSENLTLNFQQEFSKYDRISINNIFTHTYEPRSFEDEFGRTSGRYGYYRNKFNFDYTRDITKQFSVTAKYANEIDYISREDMKDSYLNRAGIEADYSLSSTTILFVSYDFMNRKFVHDDDSSTNSIASGIRHYLTKQIYFDGRIGVDFIRSYNDENYTRPLISASITDELDENTRLSISFKKEDYTSSYEEDLFNHWRASVLFTRQLAERLSCSLSGFYGEGKYVLLDIKDKLLGASIACSYDFRENLKGNLKYTYSDVNSTIESRKYTKNTVTLGLSIDF
ncbi:MAG: outer membrane beta-barrel protein [Candidatus Aureabacteria bacterium]|nr:outer membrane beta-barrel protein [Candidatus Auribacterota bacterium]MCK5161896.1 outer membrane beta-barrel protein [Candidatus Auribacterota bacterium]